MRQSSFTLLALAAAASANPVKDLSQRDSGSFCSAALNYVSGWGNAATASSFCSSFEGIRTATITALVTNVANITASTTITSTVTVQPTSTEYVTQTCTTSGSMAKRSAAATVTSCKTCDQRLYVCNFQGTLSSPSTISGPPGCGTVDTCRAACMSNSACSSFSFDTSKKCVLYSKSTMSMGLKKSSSSPQYFYEKSCFSCTTTTVPTPSSTSSCNTFPIASSVITSACSCLGINPSPSVTTTVTVSTAKIVTTSTAVVTTTTTLTQYSTTQSIVATTTFAPNNTAYTVSDGDVYAIYPNTDFLGYNIAWGSCGSKPDDTVDTGVYGDFSCQSFYDCANTCSLYNDAVLAANSTAAHCVAFVFSEGTPNCYLKSAIPGFGAPVCEVITQPFNNDAGVLISRHGLNSTTW